MVVARRVIASYVTFASHAVKSLSLPRPGRAFPRKVIVPVSCRLGVSVSQSYSVSSLFPELLYPALVIVIEDRYPGPLLVHSNVFFLLQIDQLQQTWCFLQEGNLDISVSGITKTLCLGTEILCSS